MLLVRETFHCKPGKVKPMVEKLLAMGKLSQKHGMGKFRVLTDLVGEHYWTVVFEMETANLKAFEDMMSDSNMSGEDVKQFEEIMKGYHDLLTDGRREIFKIEG